MRNGFEHIVFMFEEVIKFSLKHPGSHIVICGLIPDPEENDSFRKRGCKTRFQQASEALRHLCSRYPKNTSFVNAPLLFTRKGIVRKGINCCLDQN